MSFLWSLWIIKRFFRSIPSSGNEFNIFLIDIILFLFNYLIMSLHIISISLKLFGMIFREFLYNVFVPFTYLVYSSDLPRYPDSIFLN